MASREAEREVKDYNYWSIGRMVSPALDDNDGMGHNEEEEEEEEGVGTLNAFPWILHSQTKTSTVVTTTTEVPDLNPLGLGTRFFSDMEHYFNREYSTFMPSKFHQMDSVVPAKNMNVATSSAIATSDFPPPFVAAPGVLEVGVVPDGNLRANQAAVAAQTGPVAVAGTDREARVLRYREKRKNRKYEKTIRYASRKAYAEARPRVKGRFVKRAESEEDGEAVPGGVCPCDVGLMVDLGYRVVPSL